MLLSLPGFKKIQVQPQVNEKAQLVPPCCSLKNKKTHKTEKLSVKKRSSR